MDRLEAMSLLLTVVEEGSLSAGARRLRVPLATVSRKVAELEQRLGAQLLLRGSRRLALTEPGRAYVEAARRILDEVEEAERAAAGEFAEPRGELTLTAPVMFGRRHVLPVALEFLAANPRIDLRLALGDRQASLLDEHIDLALRIGHLEDSGLIAIRLGQVRRVICASPAYLARRGWPAAPGELPGHDGISFRNFPTSPEWRYRADNPALEVEPRPRLAVNTTEAAIDAALDGLGLVRLLSYQVVDELRAGALVAVLEEFAPAPIPVQLVHAGHRLAPAKLRAFLDWAAPRLRARLAAIEGIG